MLKIFLLSSAEVREVKKNHPILKGKKLIASGMFSGVFEGNSPNTVLKLTICPATHSMLTEIDDVHSPKLIKDYGVVGEFMTGTNVTETKLTKPVRKLVPMYLVEVEKLHKIKPGPNRKAALSISKEMMSCLSESAMCGESSTDIQAQALLRLHTYNDHFTAPSFQNYFQKLVGFVRGNGNAFFDIHAANLMQREDGTIVFADPVGTNDIYETNQATFRPVMSVGEVNWTEVKKRHREQYGHMLEKTP